jgi:hypothetical protein
VAVFQIIGGTDDEGMRGRKRELRRSSIARNSAIFQIRIKGK